ncbi:cytochrome-c oxidase, cbb3-type subunit III [Polynucleobacter cosmopolitanus]|jgi:cytochrome c oxidase cbb3-type subunit 3|uniref:Cbb3-type cytochrome c oxidase subunit n=1 Tax=Polynucleobacter cosmopolitanus TaxID=351345 RepID=A0A229FR14_9BURK|nr:cytochrome-c oxidase, cbb3-type subunit III [Polynucleobacter cosmopolitanus]OXL14445.1 cytochrome-c oxidase, cbb3-type subunit III [Polynucleobacter cosmopolitanus]
MSDFFSSGWGIYIALVTGVGIIWCLYLLFSQRKTNVTYEADGSVADTGHVWDGDLRELNNPLPRWWMWMFVLSCVFAIVYLVLYPGMGTYEGSLGYTTRNAHEASVVQANQQLKPVYAKYMSMDVKQVAADPAAREMGQRLFLNHCAQCHGSDAGGSKGFPNLADTDWLYGGDTQDIKQTLIGGRAGVMPAFAHLESAQVSDVANYVRSLSGLAADQIKVGRGAEVYKANCAACHGAEGKGMAAMGAPNLTDKVWLYGGSEATIVETVLKGRNGMMPAHETILTPEKIHLLTAYVWGLSNVKDKNSK